MIVNKVFDFKLSKSTLQRFYSRENIRYKARKQVYKTYLLQQPRLDKERKLFSHVLASLIYQNVPVIYQDESSFNSWFCKSKSWTNQYQANIHAINNKRISVNVFGAVGHCLSGKVVWWITDSTKTDKYQLFLRKVAAKVRHDCKKKPVLLYDGYRPHNTKGAKFVAKQYFMPLQNVAHSSDMNSIETLWSVAK